MNDEKEITAFMETVSALEGLEFNTFEEARLTYKSRQKLPASAFCGPQRSYPAHDASHVRNAFVRLATFGRKLSPAVRSRIHGCLKRRAKRFKVEHGGCWICKGRKKVSETIDWYVDRHPEIFGGDN